MWRKWWDGAGSGARGGWQEPELPDTDWTPPPQQQPAATESKSAKDQADEAAAFLARVYTFQQC